MTSVITDRDIAMAAYLQGKTLGEIEVAAAMSRRLVTVQPTDNLRDEPRTGCGPSRCIASRVVDALGSLKGMLTLNDLVHHLRTLKALGVEPAEIAGTLAAISCRARSRRAMLRREP